MTRLRTFPAPTFHSMSLTRAAFFHARVGDTPALCSVLDHGLPADACNERGETLILLGVERPIVGALELDADGEIIAAAAPAPIRGAGVPRAAPYVGAAQGRQVPGVRQQLHRGLGGPGVALLR